MFETAALELHDLYFAPKTITINAMEEMLSKQGWTSENVMHFSSKTFTAEKMTDMLENDGWVRA